MLSIVIDNDPEAGILSKFEDVIEDLLKKGERTRERAKKQSFQSQFGLFSHARATPAGRSLTT